MFKVFFCEDSYKPKILEKLEKRGGGDKEGKGKEEDWKAQRGGCELICIFKYRYNTCYQCLTLKI